MRSARRGFRAIAFEIGEQNANFNAHPLLPVAAGGFQRSVLDFKLFHSIVLTPPLIHHRT